MTVAGRLPAKQVSAAEFRHAMGHFATGVTVITSLSADGSPVGTTANAVTSLSPQLNREIASSGRYT